MLAQLSRALILASATGARGQALGSLSSAIRNRCLEHHQHLTTTTEDDCVVRSAPFDSRCVGLSHPAAAGPETTLRTPQHSSITEAPAATGHISDLLQLPLPLPASHLAYTRAYSSVTSGPAAAVLSGGGGPRLAAAAAPAMFTPRAAAAAAYGSLPPPLGWHAQPQVAAAGGMHVSGTRGSASSGSSGNSGSTSSGGGGRSRSRGSGGTSSGGGSGGGGRPRDPEDVMIGYATLEELQGVIDQRLAVWCERQDVSTMSAAFGRCGKVRGGLGVLSSGHQQKEGKGQVVGVACKQVRAFMIAVRGLATPTTRAPP